MNYGHDRCGHGHGHGLRLRRHRCAHPYTPTPFQVTRAAKRIKLDGGLVQRGEAVKVTRAGTLRHAPPSTYWVDSRTRRYIAADEDAVIGIVDDRSSANYRLNIWGSAMGSLPLLAFDGATKRNKPDLKLGPALLLHPAKTDATALHHHSTMPPPLNHPTLSTYHAATPRPRQVGDIVYARVAMAGVELGVDTELSCHVVSGSRKDWQTGEVS